MNLLKQTNRLTVAAFPDSFEEQGIQKQPIQTSIPGISKKLSTSRHAGSKINSGIAEGSNSELEDCNCVSLVAIETEALFSNHLAYDCYRPPQT